MKTHRSLPATIRAAATGLTVLALLAACGGGESDLSTRLGRQIVASFEPESITVDAGGSATADLALRCEDRIADDFEVQRVTLSDTRIRAAGLAVNTSRECATPTADPDVNTARLRVGVQVEAGLAPGRYTLDVIVATVGEAFADSTSARLTIIVRAAAGSNLLLNPDFEQPVDVGALPTGPGYWRGDVAAAVPDENDIAAHAGTRMLKFIATGNVSSTNTVASQQWQIVELADYAADIAAGRARADGSVWFNRVAGDAGTDRRFDLRLLAFSGSPADMPARYAAGDWLAVQEASVATAGNRWEQASAGLVLPTGTSYLLFEIYAFEDVVNEGAGAEFAGHYADDAALLITQVTP